MIVSWILVGIVSEALALVSLLVILWGLFAGLRPRSSLVASAIIDGLFMIFIGVYPATVPDGYANADLHAPSLPSSSCSP